jgi:lysozyme
MAQVEIRADHNAVNLSPAGAEALYRRECSPPDFAPALTAYFDHEGGVWTIGCGITGPTVVEGLTITREQADAMFRERIKPVEDCINGLVKVPLTQNQFDALVSWCWNVGIGHATGSKLVKVLNAGRYEQVPPELRRWVYSGGKVSQGLVNRRNSEIGQWTKGAFVSSSSSVDAPPGWIKQWHNRLIAAGVTSAVGDVASTITADRLTEAGNSLQALSAHSRVFAVVGIALIVLGVFWKFRKTNQ